jgi:K+-sensing histidine kinase KdpD
MMSDLPQATGTLLGNNHDDITGTVWLLGHDLKSPVSIIISALEVILMMNEGEESFEPMLPLVKGALSAANRQHNMISDVLDLARLELNQYELQMGENDLRDIITDTLESEEYAINTKQVKLVTDLPEYPLRVNVERELLNRTISALIDNSLKFTVKGDILTISGKHENGQVVVTLEDNGRAILPAYETQIMQRAPQWEMRQAGSRTSVGMGIPFAYAAIKAHGGDFRASTDPTSKRTTFRFALPIYQPKPVKPD